MALVLSVGRGGSIYIGEIDPIKVVVEQIYSSQKFQVRVVGVTMDHLYTITSRMSIEIVPHVFVSAGRGTSQVAQFVVEAPRSIKVMREELMDAISKGREPVRSESVPL